MRNIFLKLLDWFGRADAFATIVQFEFVRTLIWPTVLTVSAAVAGWVQGVPMMWVIVGSTLTFMAASQGLLRASEYMERRNPQNKLRYSGFGLACDLDPIEVPFAGSRKTRRAASAQKIPPTVLGSGEIRLGVRRTLDKAQVFVNLQNTASFPISVILSDAKTEIAGEKPPRSTFPKAASLIQPGSRFRTADDAIQMDGEPCGRLEGKVDMTIKYGLPGHEKFELRLIADLDIIMEEWGIVTNINAHLRLGD